MANGKQSTASAPESRTGYNGSGVAIAKGTIVKLVAGGEYAEIAKCSAENSIIYGVAAEDIAIGEYGLLYIRGIVPTLCSAALTVGGRVGTTNAGLAVDAGEGDTILGVALEVGAASQLAEVELLGPGSSNYLGVDS